MDVTTLTTLLRETEHHHGAYEAVAPRHHWSDWYAAFMVAREQGLPVAQATKAASLHMEEILR
jgi:hypothetical protein